jgi:predicted dehydrogenase
MNRKLNVAIAGYGWAATAHIPAINASHRAQVTAIYSSRPQDAAALSAQYGCAIKTTTEFAELLRDPAIDVIDITSAPDRHKELFLAAVAAGKHVIVEKPVAMNLADCEAMLAAAEKRGVRTSVCFEARFCNQFQVTRALLDQGLLGDLHYGEVDYYHGIGPWYGQFRWNITKASGGSALLTAGCHALDALLFFLGTDVAEVSSYNTRSRNPIFAPYEYPTSCVTILKFKSGRVGKCAAIVDCLQPYYCHLHLVGSEGSLLDNKLHSMKLKTDKQHWSTLAMQMLDSGDVKDHPYQAQFDAFFQAVTEGREMPLTSLQDAIHTFRVLFAADQSAATGKPVRLD